MKIRNILSVVLLLSATFFAEARYITEFEALSKAKNFMSVNKLKSSDRGFMKLAHKELKSGTADYYVFSKGENAGFVIVSGSDCTDEILGYVDNGNFDRNSMPGNVAYWLDEYARQIEYSEANNLKAAKVRPTAGKSVAPLLGNINWNQDSPFNDQCPVLEDGSRAASGCVATAFAQVMYYYKWPETGEGSHSYTSDRLKIDLSADFGATSYRWNAMNPFYNNSSSAESRDAVAELLFHVGVSCNMNYGPSSGAGSTVATEAMTKYFRYDNRITCLYRDYYSRDEWTEILKNELDNRRPVPYAGSAKNGGHQFVFDGYDENDMFHVNWGWGGAYNGYFKVSVLTPEGQGIGGYSGGYNLFQSATVGMMKPDASVEIPRYCPLNGKSVMVSTATISQGESFKFRINSLYNNDFRHFDGSINVGLYNGKGELVAVGASQNEYSLDFNYGWDEYNADNSLSGVPDGTYNLCPIFKYNDRNEWEKIRLKALGNSVRVTVTGNTMKLENVMPEIDFEIIDIVVGESYENQPTSVKYKIINNGDEYDRPLSVAVFKKDDLFSPVYCSAGVITPILKGETISVETVENFKLPAGDYVLNVVDEYGLEFGDYVDFSVLKAVPIDLSLTSIESEKTYKRDSINFKLTFTNTGAPYNNGSIYVYIYKGNTPPVGVEGSVDVMLKNNVSFPGNNTSTVVEFNESMLLEEGDYYAWPGYKVGKNVTLMEKGFTFYLLNEESGVEMVETDNGDLSIYPNPVDDVLNINTTGNLTKVSVFSISGALVKQAAEARVEVDNLMSGTYIVVAEIDGKPVASTFIKK